MFSQHCKACRGYGFSDEKIEAIKAWGVSDLFDAGRAGRCSPTPTPSCSASAASTTRVFDALHEHLSDEEILEFTYITMMYTMHAVISRALRLEYDDRDDPIVEIAAPADYVPENLGRQIAYGMDKAEAEAKD